MACGCNGRRSPTDAQRAAARAWLRDVAEGRRPRLRALVEALRDADANTKAEAAPPVDGAGAGGV